MNNETITIYVPTTLKKEFKMVCLQQDTNMNEVTRDFIEKYVDKYKNNPKNI